jgi:hypothetical protein
MRYVLVFQLDTPYRLARVWGLSEESRGDGKGGLGRNKLPNTGNNFRREQRVPALRRALWSR